jgi:hypothetical protein
LLVLSLAFLSASSGSADSLGISLLVVHLAVYVAFAYLSCYRIWWMLRNAGLCTSCGCRPRHQAPSSVQPLNVAVAGTLGTNSTKVLVKAGPTSSRPNSPWGSKDSVGSNGNGATNGNGRTGSNGEVEIAAIALSTAQPTPTDAADNAAAIATTTSAAPSAAYSTANDTNLIVAPVDNTEIYR